MDSAPDLITGVDGEGEWQNNNSLELGDNTAILNQLLNAVTDQEPTNRFLQRDPASILQYPDVGLYDSMYYPSTYRMLPVDNQVTQVHHYESPEVPVTNLPFSQALYNSTLVQEQVNGQIVYNLRAPGINEGYGT